MAQVDRKPMHIVGKDFLQSCLAEEGYFLKLILNEHAAHFFPHNTEHSDASLPGLRYQHESLGNAVAATIKPAQINIRRHRAFSAERLKAIVERLETAMGNSPAGKSFDVNYGNEFLNSITM